jgi:GxxExxY protein
VHENEIGKLLVDSALKVHRILGPGLLESVYDVALAHELRTRGCSVQRQVAFPIVYEGLVFDEGFRADLVINSLVVVELKSVEKNLPVHAKQVLTYLRLSNLRLGFLLNFGMPYLRDGIERIVNGLTDKPLAS